MRARLLALALVALGTSACDHPLRCNPHTLFVSVTLSGAAISADTLVVTVTADGTPGQPATLPHTPGTGAGGIEVQFQTSYPQGKAVSVTIEARVNGAAVATGTAAVAALADGCDVLQLSVGALGDGSTMDLCTPMTVCPASAVCGMVSDGCTGMLDCGACQLNSLSPTLAAPNESLVLEGRFGAIAEVIFPSGAKVAANVLGANRATVVVPAGAGEGVLSVTTNGVTTPGLPFRSPTFAIGLQPFHHTYPQANYGRQFPALAVFRSRGAIVNTGQYLFVLGGENNTPEASSVEQAPINADGTIGTFAASTNGLTTARTDPAAIQVGNFVYVIGGATTQLLGDGGMGNRASNTIERAAIDPTGTIGVFSAISSTLGTARFRASVNLIGNYLYVIGGTSGDNPTDVTSVPITSIERAVVMVDGSLGPFQDAGVALQVPRDAHTSEVIANFLYVIGGGHKNGLSTVERSPIAGDGTLGAFADGPALPTPTTGSAARAHHRSHVFGKTLYVFGGGPAPGSELTTIATSAIQPDGSLGAWSFSTIMAQRGRTQFFSALVGDRVYLIGGGLSECPSACFIDRTRTVEAASIDMSATLGPLSNTGAPAVGIHRNSACAVVIGDGVYLVGGVDAANNKPTTSVERAPLKPDGTLGPFVDTGAGNGLVVGRGGAACAVVGDSLFVTGGRDNTNTELPSIERAVIKPDRTLGTFAPATNVLSTARSGHALAVISSYDGTDALWLVSIGGASGGTTVERVAITGDLLTGNFAAFGVPARVLGTARTQPVLYLEDHTLEALGGVFGSGNTFDGAVTDDTGEISGQFASATSLNTIGISGAAGFTFSNNLYLGGGFTGVNFSGGINQATSAVNGTLGAFTPSVSTFLEGRTSHSTVVVGNHVYILGGNGNNGATDNEAAERR